MPTCYRRMLPLVSLTALGIMLAQTTLQFREITASKRHEKRWQAYRQRQTELDEELVRHPEWVGTMQALRPALEMQHEYSSILQEERHDASTAYYYASNINFAAALALMTITLYAGISDWRRLRSEIPAKSVNQSPTGSPNSA